VNPLLGIVVVLAALALLMGAVLLVRIRFAPPAEWTRKLVHLGIGLIALTFPWTLRNEWVVATACALGFLGLIAARRSRRYGGYVEMAVGVDRVSWGEICFPATVAVLFFLVGDDPVLYAIPLMVLTFADAAAAIVGLHYGVLRYGTEEGHKSTEGSLVFLVIAFLSVHVPLLLFTDAGRVDSLLIALLVAFIGMLVEAVSSRGFDNLAMPLLVLVVLRASLERPAVELSLQVVVAIGLTVFVFLARQGSPLRGSGSLGAVLVGYLSWAFGGWQWMLAPVLTFVGNGYFVRPKMGPSIYSGVVLQVAWAGLVWLALSGMLARESLIVPFVFSFAVQLAMLAIRHLRLRRNPMHRVVIVSASTVVAWVSLYVPFVLLGQFDGIRLVVAYWLLIATATVSWYFHHRLVEAKATGDRPLLWREQGTYGALASLLGLIPLFML